MTLTIPYNRVTGFYRSLDPIGWALLYAAWGILAMFTLTFAWSAGIISQVGFFMQICFMGFCAVRFRARVEFDREMGDLLLATRRDRGSGLER